MAFVKLDCGMLNSTLWFEREAREVFITALLMAEPFELHEPAEQIEIGSLDMTGWVVPPGWYGFVEASGPGIVDRAKVPMKSGMDALKKLGDEDLESRSKDYGGRRLIRVDGGFIVLNYMKYRDRDYTSAERSKRYRERQASRRDSVASHRDITQAEGEGEGERDLPSQDQATNSHSGGVKISAAESSKAVAPRLDQDGRVLGNGVAQSLVPVNPHNNPKALINGHDMRRHGVHAWCSMPARDGLCVPQFLHTELMGRGAKSDAQMRAWYESTIAHYAGQAIGDRDLDFWRNEFASWVGTVTQRPSDRQTKGVMAKNAAERAAAMIIARDNRK